MDATLKNSRHARFKALAIMQAIVYDRGKKMQDPPIAGRPVLLIDKQPIFWTQPMV